MSLALDLKMRVALDEHLKTLGTGDGFLNTLDLTPVGIFGIDSADLQIVGESPLGIEMESGRTWIEGALVKNPQDIITPSSRGTSRKKDLFVVFVKSPKEEGLYFNEAISALVEEHFPNNKHIAIDGYTLTILKTFQQPTTYVDNDTGRYWNRVFVECEIYYENNK